MSAKGVAQLGGRDDVAPHAAVARLAGPRELVHGERESFIGGYRRQHSGLVAGSPAMSAGGGGCIRVSSR